MSEVYIRSQNKEKLSGQDASVAVISNHTSQQRDYVRAARLMNYTQTRTGRRLYQK